MLNIVFDLWVLLLITFICFIWKTDTLTSTFIKMIFAITAFIALIISVKHFI